MNVFVRIISAAATGDKYEAMFYYDWEFPPAIDEFTNLHLRLIFTQYLYCGTTNTVLINCNEDVIFVRKLKEIIIPTYIAYISSSEIRATSIIWNTNMTNNAWGTQILIQLFIVSATYYDSHRCNTKFLYRLSDLYDCSMYSK